jgi:hypothetical protein
MYLIDSDVFIDAKNRHYAFDIVPAFWDWLSSAHQTGRVFTVERVAQEVLAGADELATWMAAQPPSFALRPTPGDQTALQTVSQWANLAAYRAGAAAVFLGSGDYFLVGQALSLGYTVVTHEVPAPGSDKKIKIPDACRAVGVPCMSPFEMLRTEGARFTL